MHLYIEASGYVAVGLRRRRQGHLSIEAVGLRRRGTVSRVTSPPLLTRPTIPQSDNPQSFIEFFAIIRFVGLALPDKNIGGQVRKRTKTQFIDGINDLAQVVAAGYFIFDLAKDLADFVFDSIGTAGF